MSAIKPQIIRHNHSVCLIIYHFVVVCKNRRKELTNEITIDLLKEAISKYPITIIDGAIGGQNHIHLIIQTDSTLAPKDISRIIKGCSQVMIRKILHNWSGWARSYYISTVDNNSIERLGQYIHRPFHES